MSRDQQDPTPAFDSTSRRHSPTGDSVVVYYKPGCPFGIRLRAALRLRRVVHRSVRFRDDEEGAAAVRAVNAGNEISPTVRIGDVWLSNPSARTVKQAVRRRHGPAT